MCVQSCSAVGLGDEKQLGRFRKALGEEGVDELLARTMEVAVKRLVMQTGSRKAVDNRAKLYSWHAPEVECISKVRAAIRTNLV